MRLAVPRSVLLGRVVAAGEPAWLPEDVNYLLGLMEWERSNCSGCGQSLVESADPDNADLWDSKTVVCHGCAAIERKHRALSSDEEPFRDHKRDGVKVFAVLDQAVEPGG